MEKKTIMLSNSPKVSGIDFLFRTDISFVSVKCRPINSLNHIDIQQK